MCGLPFLRAVMYVPVLLYIANFVQLARISQVPIEKGIAFAEVNKSDLRQAVGRILDPLIAGHPGSLLRAFIVHLASLLEVYGLGCLQTISHLDIRERLNQ
jgi:hypothetical protein